MTRQATRRKTKTGKRPVEAYLDIETTGLSRFMHDITVVGICICDGKRDKIIQLVGEHVNGKNLKKALDGVDTIYTYYGSRFDLPFIEAALDVDLESAYEHHDLMYDCWANGLKGGLKAVCERLGITRSLSGIDGRQAVDLWYRHINHSDQKSLDTLLQYNRDDINSLKVLKEILLG